MHPRAGVRRLLLVLMISLAACAPGGSPGPSGSTPSGPAATTGTSASGAPVASPIAIVLPACTDPYAVPVHPGLLFANVRGQPMATLRRVVATSAGSLGFVVRLPDSAGSTSDDLGVLVGAHPIEFSFVATEGPLDPTRPPVVTQARATLQSGTAPAVPLEITIRQADTVLQIPDLADHVSMAMTVDWTDGCFTYEGEVAETADLVLATTFAACPTSSAGLQAAANAVGQTQIRIGSVSHLLTLEGWYPKFVDGGGGENLSMFQGTDFKSAPQPIVAGREITVTGPVGDTHIRSIEAMFYRLDQVLPDPLTATPDSVFSSVGVSRIDGSFGVHVPTTRGTWVMEISVGWDTSCLTGSGREWVTLQTT